MEAASFPHPVRDRCFLQTLPDAPQGGSLADILLDAPAQFHLLRLAGEENSSVRVTRRAILHTQDYSGCWLHSSHTPNPRARSSPPFRKHVWCESNVKKPPESHSEKESCVRSEDLSPMDTALPSRSSYATSHLCTCAHRRKASKRHQRGLHLTVGTYRMVSSTMISPSVSLPNKGCFHISLTLLL